MDNQKLQSLMGQTQHQTQHHNVEAEVKEKELAHLKQQINEFVKERNGWLEEIERKQAEMMSAHVALEKLRHAEQFLATENEMLKMENVNHKKKVMELEVEIKKLSGQQNIQQRIHHHAKIKEENNSLRCRNEDLSIKLRKSEAILSRVKEEAIKQNTPSSLYSVLLMHWMVRILFQCLWIVYLKVLYNVFGWVAFISWSVCFYPQIILNFRRKSVVGFNFDFALMNMIKQLAYLIYNTSILFSSTVQKQYRRKFGNDKMLPVAESDLAFSIHVVLVSAFTMYQIAVYDVSLEHWFSRVCVCGSVLSYRITYRIVNHQGAEFKLLDVVAECCRMVC